MMIRGRTPASPVRTAGRSRFESSVRFFTSYFAGRGSVKYGFGSRGRGRPRNPAATIGGGAPVSAEGALRAVKVVMAHGLISCNESVIGFAVDAVRLLP